MLHYGLSVLLRYDCPLRWSTVDLETYVVETLGLQGRKTSPLSDSYGQISASCLVSSFIPHGDKAELSDSRAC